MHHRFYRHSVHGYGPLPSAKNAAHEALKLENEGLMKPEMANLISEVGWWPVKLDGTVALARLLGEE